MPALPQAAFAVRKIRERNEQQVAVMKKASTDEKRSSSTRYDSTKCKYSSCFCIAFTKNCTQWIRVMVYIEASENYSLLVIKLLSRVFE